jgi:hypothetical protein
MTTTVLPWSTSGPAPRAGGGCPRSAARWWARRARRRCARWAPAELAGQLDPLRLAARQGRRRLAQPDVAQADVDQRLHVAGDGRLLGEEGERLLAGQVEHVGDGLAPEGDLERVAVVAGPVADLAGDVDVGQEVHLDLDGAVAGAGLAAAAAHVEGEAPGQVAPHLGLGRLGEELADVVEHAGVGGRVRTRRAADGRLVDVDHLVEVLDALDLAVPAGQGLGPVQLLGQRAQQDVVDQRRLARARDAGDRHQAAERERDVDVLEVVLPGAAHGDHVAGAGPAAGRHRDGALAREVLAGDGRLVGEQPARPVTGPAWTTVPPCSPAPGRCRPRSRRRGWSPRRAPPR